MKTRTKTVSQALPFALKSQVVVSERLGSLRVVVSDETGRRVHLSYVSASSLNGRPTNRCPGDQDGNRFKCVLSGVRTLKLQGSQIKPQDPWVEEHAVLLLEEEAVALHGQVSIAFVTSPIERGGELPPSVPLDIESVDCECVCSKQQRRLCAQGERRRRIIGIRRSDSIASCPSKD